MSSPVKVGGDKKPLTDCDLPGQGDHAEEDISTGIVHKHDHPPEWPLGLPCTCTCR